MRGKHRIGSEMTTKTEQPEAIVQFTLPAAAYRIRRLDPRNLVIEAQQPAGHWKIHGYYGNAHALASALLQLAAQLPDSEARDLTQAVTDLRAAIDANARRIAAALDGGRLTDY
jgi:hypothetical protein